MRKKFAFILAMVLSATPVMAASTNSLTKLVSVIEGTTISYDATKVDRNVYYTHTVPDSEIRIELQDGVLDDQVFYINAVDSIFEKPAYASWALGADVYTNRNNIYDTQNNKIDDFLIDTDKYSIRWINETQLEVTLKAGETLYKLPLIVKATTGMPMLQIDETSTILTGGNIRLTNKPLLKYGIQASVKDSTILPTDGYGSLGIIHFKENLVTALSGKTIKLELEPNSGLEFFRNQTNTNDDLFVSGRRGYSSSIKDDTFKFIIDEIDNQIAYIQIPELKAESGAPELEIGNIRVKAQGQEDVQLGDVRVEVSTVKGVQNYDLTEDLNPIKLTLAQVQEGKVTVSNQPTIEVVAGLTNDIVNVTIEDLTGEILTGKRNIYLLAEGARFLTGEKEIEIEIDEEEQEVKEINIDVTLAPTLNQTGDIKIISQSRDFDKDIVTIVGRSVPAVKIDTEEIFLERDTKPEPAGKIVINETMDTILKNGKVIAIKVEDLAIKDMDIETKGIEIDYKVKNGVLLMEVTKQSKEKGQIVIENIKFDISRPAGIGNYELMIGGNALSNLNQESYFEDYFEIEDFVQVSQPRYEHIQVIQPRYEDMQVKIQPIQPVKNTTNLQPQIKIDVTKDKEKQVNINSTKEEPSKVNINSTKEEPSKVNINSTKEEPSKVNINSTKEEPSKVNINSTKEEPSKVNINSTKEEPSKVNINSTKEEKPEVNIDIIKMPEITATVNTATGMATLNGKIMHLDGTPFITESNVSMMGVRDITNFLHIKDISFNNGVISIYNKGDLIELQNGSNILIKNGERIVMDEKVLIINGRTYAPVKFIGDAVDFDITVNGQITTFSK
ncbi:hypothetical protein AN396_04910 [Candidatus Epulonipiscium fishelsonii]|uniref:Uncharacterized protein n=1 Tax=Candidatus Epulonipiscium fishelsonii TaxID=77094 RepID=A0ACC8XE02_9FIRM|nr:hypothetical protein AN396_04910 [Epulopiscium sp. SCG-B11WGA-EpuloA1]